MQTTATRTAPPHHVRDLTIDVQQLSSPVLARLVEEVRQERHGNTAAYNRTHNRHNRGR